jgi:hypothetical protein
MSEQFAKFPTRYPPAALASAEVTVYVEMVKAVPRPDRIPILIKIDNVVANYGSRAGSRGRET